MENIKKGSRVWEIDFMRGVALLLMIIFHVVFDLKDIYNYPVSYESGIYYYVGKAAAILFMFLSGISCYFSRSNIKRGIRVFLIALGISLVTFLFDKNLFIKFGILHFLGIAMISYPLFKRINGYALTVLGIVVIVIGNYMSRINMPYDYLFPIGLTSVNFFSADYYPIFPWLGIFMIGIAFGRFLYSERRSLFNFEMRNNPFLFLGRHTLWVYLIHQPVILLVLNFIMKK